MKRHGGMTAWRLGLAAVLCGALASAARAMDSVKTTSGTLSGQVISQNATRVNFQAGIGAANKETKEIPANEIVTIYFEGDPSDLRSAKQHVVGGRFTAALEALNRLKENVSSRSEIKQDIEFYKALCTARLALAGDGKIAEAGRQMNAFIGNSPDSYHYYEAIALVGELLVAVQQYPQAVEFYARLEKAPWSATRLSAGVAIGRILLVQDKYDEALQAFGKVAGSKESGDAADMQRTLANLGRAAVLVNTKHADEAVAAVEEILRKADPKDAATQARGYNVLGSAKRQAGQKIEAVTAFLRVDLMYPEDADAHAEALANLTELWEQLHKPDRAQRAQRTLQEQYPNSPWAKKAGG